MKTSQLVELLTSDGTRTMPQGRALLRVLLPAGLFSAALLVVLIGIRGDVGAAVHTVRFDLKLLLNVALWFAATGLLLRLARPVDRPGWWWTALWIVPVVLLLAVLVELVVLPREQWWPVAHGSNSTWCLRIIPALAALPLAVSLWVLRSGAPSRPALTGAAAGLMCAGMAGTLYALHCPDDSPLFVAIWYVLAAGIVTLAGALLGARLLRW